VKINRYSIVIALAAFAAYFVISVVFEVRNTFALTSVIIAASVVAYAVVTKLMHYQDE
jgi:hypothetical protein